MVWYAIGNPQNSNPYNYVLNNPLVLADPGRREPNKAQAGTDQQAVAIIQQIEYIRCWYFASAKHDFPALLPLRQQDLVSNLTSGSGIDAKSSIEGGEIEFSRYLTQALVLQ